MGGQILESFVPTSRLELGDPEINYSIFGWFAYYISFKGIYLFSSSKLQISKYHCGIIAQNVIQRRKW